MSLSLFFKSGLVLLLSSFMLVSAVSFLRFRIKKRDSDYKRIVSVLGIEDQEAQFSTRTVSEEYAPQDYYLPVLFVTVVSIFGFTSLLFGEELVNINAGKANLLLTGVFLDPEKVDLDQMRWQSMLVLSMAFMGAFVWSSQNIIRRLIAGDLAPSTYYSSAMRIIFAAILSLMLSFLLEGMPTREYTREALPVIAFLTGMLPEQALLYMRERIGIFSERASEKAADLPLHMIEGINMFHRLRLSEVGIDNAQNLAEANMVELLLKTPFNPSQLVDWIAQARLFVYFKSDVEKLRKISIRTIFDYRYACSEEDQLNKIAEETGISELTLAMVRHRLEHDQAVVRLLEFDNKLSLMMSPGSKVKNNSQ